MHDGTSRAVARVTMTRSGLRFGLLPLLLLASGVLAVACGSEEGDSDSASAAASKNQATLLDVNDVSILFPAGKGAERHTFFPQIPVSAKEADLWSQDNFDRVMKAAKLSTVTTDSRLGTGYPMESTDRDNWRIVSLRFDPCAPGLSAVRADTDGKRFQHRCHVQLRLVAEPKPASPELVAPSEDFAAHLIYDLKTISVDEVASDPLIRGIVSRLVAIKEMGAREGNRLDVTSGKPLGPHPKLARRDAAGQRAAEAVKSLIFDATEGKILKDGAPSPVGRRIAFMGLRKGGEEWVFLTGQADANGRWEQSPQIPTLPPPKKDEFTNPNGVAFQALTSTLEIVDGPFPKPVSAVASTTPFFDQSGAPEERRKQLFQVENPATVDVFNTDCVSCHMSSVAKSQSDGLGSTDVEKRARMPIPAGITGYIEKTAQQRREYDVHAFGNFLEPSVSGRTLNESVEVARFVNDEVIQREAATKRLGPGLTCADDLQVQLCLLGSFDDAKNCFEGCKKAK